MIKLNPDFFSFVLSIVILNNNDIEFHDIKSLKHKHIIRQYLRYSEGNWQIFCSKLDLLLRGWEGSWWQENRSYWDFKQNSGLGRQVGEVVQPKICWYSWVGSVQDNLLWFLLSLSLSLRRKLWKGFWVFLRRMTDILNHLLMAPPPVVRPVGPPPLGWEHLVDDGDFLTPTSQVKFPAPEERWIVGIP